MPRALEHHVLEQMGEPGLAGQLVLRADVVPDVDGYHRCEMVLGDDQAETVLEALIGERHGRDGGRRHACLLGKGRRSEVDRTVSGRSGPSRPLAARPRILLYAPAMPA